MEKADAVLAEMREGFAGIHRRIEELSRYQREMNGKANRAHERISSLEAVMTGAQDTLAYMWKRIHDVANVVTGLVAASSDKPTVTVGPVSLDAEMLTFGRLRSWVVFAVAVVGATYFIMTAVLGFTR